ncbi:MAG TPA: hypothetical protein VJY34_15500 [Roseiarcus sp.]|nr:hypothetical protein [Roseiarcus sp.]
MSSQTGFLIEILEQITALTESVQTLLEQNAHLTQSVEHLTQSVETWLKQISETPNIGAGRADRSAEKRGARQDAGG